MCTFHERKAARKEYYEKFVKGWKLRDCTSCSGTGIYDNTGSPPCGACEGTGKEEYKPRSDDYDAHKAR
jgi:DnaJ-class molecular chaperone